MNTQTTPPPRQAAESGLREAPCSLVSFIGFTATKDFRSVRRAMRPQVGDTFVTRRNGMLVFTQIDWLDETWIGIGRFLAESGDPLGFCRIGVGHWRAACLAAIRQGCEFRPANAIGEARRDSAPPH